MVLRFILLFLLISSCAVSPGFKKEPSSKNPKRMGLGQNGVSLMFHNINKMNLDAMPRVEDIQKKTLKDCIISVRACPISMKLGNGRVLKSVGALEIFYLSPHLYSISLD